MAHSVPEKMAPTLAKFLPLEMEERYMSRKPCLSWARRGREVRGVAVAVAGRAAEGEPDESAAEADPDDNELDTTRDSTAVVVFAAALAVAVDALGVASTGNGCDMGVS